MSRASSEVTTAATVSAKLLVPAATLCVCLWACSGGGADGSPPDGGSPPATATANEILTKLGVKELANPPPATYASTLGTSETIDPATWQPLKKPVTVFSPRAQILQIGANVGTSWNTLFQDALSTPAYAPSVPINDDQAWEKSAVKTSVAADIDGDGLAEAVIVYVKTEQPKVANLRVLKGGAVTGETAIDVTLSGKLEPWNAGSRSGVGTPWFPFLSSARADVDGDGKDEILLVDYNTVYVLSVSADGRATVRQSKTYGTESSPLLVSSVAAGDLDGDGKDEIAVGFLGTSNGDAKWALYDSDLSKPLTNPEIAIADADGIVVELAFGDFRGNSLQQLVMATHIWTNANAGDVRVALYDFSPPPESKATKVREFRLAPGDYGLRNNDGSTDYFRILPRAVRMSATKQQQLHVLGWVYTDPMNGDDRRSTWDVFHDLIDVMTVVDVQVGDVDNDGKEELVIQSTAGTCYHPYTTHCPNYWTDFGRPAIEVIGEDSNGKLARKKLLFDSTPDHVQSFFGSTVSIAVGNFADNAARVRYAGHKLTFTDPIVIAVLAAPPYWSSITDSAYQKAYPAWLTTFGTTSTSGSDTSHTLGFTVGAQVSYKHEISLSIFGLKITEFSASNSFRNTNKWQWDSSRDVTKSVEWGCSGGQDAVVFTAVPMDEYKYEILSSNDPANKVGEFLYINVPRAFTTYKVTRDFFNQNTGNVLAPIGEDVLGHKLGNPFTYPGPARKNELMNTAFGGEAGLIDNYQIGSYPVGQGADNMPDPGRTNLKIAIATGKSKTVTHDFSYEAIVGAGAGGLTVSVIAGFNVSYFARSRTSEGTAFGGTVGYLPTSYYAAPYFYSAGLFVYPYKASTGKSFWVVNYWVE